MTWNERHQWRRFLRTSLLTYPALGLVAALLVTPALRWFDAQSGGAGFNFSVDGARAVLGAFTSSMLTFIVFVLSSLLIVLQLASQQISPRVIVQVLSSRPVKVVLGLYTFAYVLTLAALSRVEEPVPQTLVAAAVVANLAAILLFFYFVQQVGRQMRPAAIMKEVAAETRAVIADVYPHPFDPAPPSPRGPGAAASPVVVVEHAGPFGVVLSFSQADLVRLAAEADATVELVPQVGNFIAPGDPLFRVAAAGRAIDPAALRGCVAVGSERTMEQDPRFGFRILVDVACKALSPGINDPTTAVLALDQLHYLLLAVGRRKLDDGKVRDGQGVLRLVYPTPDWEDFVLLAVSEVRHYGGSSLQVARRLRALLAHLIRSLPERRQAPLRQELELLHSAVERAFPDAADRLRADVGDYQGIGGAEG